MTPQIGVLPLCALFLAACSSGSEPADAQTEDNNTAQESPADAPADLSVLFSSVDAANCGFLTEAGRAMVYEDSFGFSDTDQNEPIASEPFAVAGLEQMIEPSLILPNPADERHEIWMSLEGSWLGLSVSAMGYRFMPRSDYPQSVRIYFDEPVETVSAALAAAGFPVNPDGGVHRTMLEEDGAMYDYFGLVSFVGREGVATVFECSEQGWDEGDL